MEGGTSQGGTYLSTRKDPWKRKRRTKNQSMGHILNSVTEKMNKNITNISQIFHQSFTYKDAEIWKVDPQLAKYTWKIRNFRPPALDILNSGDSCNAFFVLLVGFLLYSLVLPGFLNSSCYYLSFYMLLRSVVQLLLWKKWEKKIVVAWVQAVLQIWSAGFNGFQWLVLTETGANLYAK